MGSYESVINDTDEDVRVWRRPVWPQNGFNFKAKVLAPGASTPKRFFTLSLVHQWCVQYRLDYSGILTFDCKVKWSPPWFGQTYTYNVTEIIGHKLAKPFQKKAELQLQNLTLKQLKQIQERLEHPKNTTTASGPTKQRLQSKTANGSAHASLAAFEPRENITEYVTPGLMVLASFMLALVGFKKVQKRRREPVRVCEEEPLLNG